MPYLIDLDGTIYCGRNPLPHAADFIGFLNQRQIPYRFLTNAPENHPEDIERRLVEMGVPARPGAVVTAAMLAVDCLREMAAREPVRRVRVLGDDYLKERVARDGFILDGERPDCVLVSFAPSITAGEIQEAACQIREGARFIATNPDDQIPSERGLVPHTGFIVSAIAACSGVKPVMAGKPSDALRERYLALFGCRPEQICVVGDRLDTDMAFARACGFRAYLMLTGAVSRQEAMGRPEAYDRLFMGLDEIIRLEESRR